MKINFWKFALIVLIVTFLPVSCPVESKGGEKNEPEIKGEWNNDFTPGGILPDWDSLEGRGYRINIDPSVKYQVMKGFAAADASNCESVGAPVHVSMPDRGLEFNSAGWNKNVQERIWDYLFEVKLEPSGHPKGIGLSQWRVELGAGSKEQGYPHSKISLTSWDELRTSNGTWLQSNVECFLADITDPFGLKQETQAGISSGKFTKHPQSGIVYNWDGKQKGQQNFMAEAKKRNPDIEFIGWTNSPPVPWTKSGTGNNVALNAQWDSASGNWLPKPLDMSGNLKDINYGDFANYLADLVEHFTDKGFNFRYITPINEPQWEWITHGQEGSSWYNINIAKITRLIHTAFQNRPGIKEGALHEAKLLIPEAAQWDFLSSARGGVYADNDRQIEAFFTPGTRDYVGDLSSVKPWAVSGHTYFTHNTDAIMRSVRETMHAKADGFKKPENNNRPIEVWSTEWCAMSNGEGVVLGQYFESAMLMAKIIHADITVANAVHWSYWMAISPERGGARDTYAFISLAPGVSTYRPRTVEDYPITASGSIRPNGSLWAMGQYSLFVRPGFQRIKLTGENINADNDKALMGSAYISNPNELSADPVDGIKKNLKRIVTVYVNFASSSRKMAAAFPGDDNFTVNGQVWGLPKRVMCFATSNAMAMAKGESHYAVNGMEGMRRQPHESGVFTVPARSICTVVYDF